MAALVMQFGESILTFFTLHAMWVMSIGSVVGLLVGALPGLTATMACALLLGMTYGLSVSDAMLTLLGVFVGAMAGGSVSAILVNVPGTPAAAATAVDGYLMARAGHGAAAIRIAAMSSAIGTVLGALSLLLLTPPLLELALNFASWEYTLFGLFGIALCGSVSSEDIPLKGWISGTIGLLLSTIGRDVIWNYPRFSYGSIELQAGVSLVPALVGLFGMAEVFYLMRSKEKVILAEAQRDKQQTPPLSPLFYLRHWVLLIQSSIVGIIIGIIPGVGGEIACWVSYDFAKRISKKKESFGKGNYEGVIASETANNATCGAVMIPALTLAIPGNAVAAVILAGLWLHGIRPGPLLEFENPGFATGMAAQIFVLAFIVLAWMLLLAGVISKVLLLPTEIIMGTVAVLCVVGSYAEGTRLFDVYVMGAFAMFAYYLRTMKYPLAPMVLGIILGPLVDENLRKALMLDPSVLPFVTRPVSLILLLALVLVLVGPFLYQRRARSHRAITEEG